MTAHWTESDGIALSRCRQSPTRTSKAVGMKVFEEMLRGIRPKKVLAEGTFSRRTLGRLVIPSWVASPSVPVAASSEDASSTTLHWVTAD